MRILFPLLCVGVIAVLACLPTGQAGDDEPEIAILVAPANCGGHIADSCEACPIDPATGNDNGEAWCNGDCTWSNGMCRSTCLAKAKAVMQVHFVNCLFGKIPRPQTEVCKEIMLKNEVANWIKSFWAMLRGRFKEI